MPSQQFNPFQPYQSNNSYTLPQSAANIIPQQLGQDFLSSLDASFQASDRKKQEDLLGFQQSRGLLNSGDTNQKLVEQVLGPQQDRNKSALTSLAVQAATTGQQQQFQSQFETQQFQHQLQVMQEQATLNSQLASLQAQLQTGSESALFGQKKNFQTSWGGLSSNLLSGVGSGFGQAAGKGLFALL